MSNKNESSGLKDIYFPYPRQEVPLNTSLQNPVWTLQDHPHGQLEGSGSSVIYIAPDFSSNSQSRNSSSDISSLLAIDIVTALGGRHYQAATMLTFSLAPQPNAKLELKPVNGHAPLKFSITNKEGKWIDVPLENTSWYILAGNGHVDKTTGNYYASADNPSPNTVVLAIDERYQFMWIFALITIPG
ncbi:hypothetical protein [Pseudomonas sp. p21]|uniref:hypothetical protein n=1 Tax=Pseudomonas sp. p21 TaxID=1825979 RepID=UPI0012E86BE0|nr:hypothetical protein [Pseudomonas sp. p21]